MKKLILVLAIILIATPAFAAVSVTLEPNTADANKVDIKYSCANASERPRAFALEVSISGGAKFTGINDYMTGESNSLPPTIRVGYGIYPARIAWDLNDVTKVRDVNNWGNPLADDVNDFGAGTGLGTGDVVLEFGSLWYSRTGEANAPPLSGTLCNLTVDCDVATGRVNILAKEEDAYRGGIVLENGTPIELADVNIAWSCGAPPCPDKATNPSPATLPSYYGKGVNITTNLSWTAGNGATSHDVYFGRTSPPSFLINQGGTTIDPCTGNLIQGKVYYWRIDERNADCVTTGDVWSFNTECVDPNAPFYTAWVGAGKTWSRPDCWCYSRNCRGDTDNFRQVSNLYWVYTYDLTLLRSAYARADAQLSQTKICGDFDRIKQVSNLYWVYTYDLTILRLYYARPVAQVPICPLDQDTDGDNDYKFWMP